MEETTVLVTKTVRSTQFAKYALDVIRHIEDYTVPQYGDYPNDQAEGFSKSEMQMNLKRYVNRITSNQRGTGEQLRDCHKMAHYSCLLNMLIIKEVVQDANAHAEEVVEKL